ncbi:MAG: fructosamine kinase family protein [Gammaproteobacteria bacterium]
MNWRLLSEEISKATNRPFKIKDARSIGGGCINTAYELRGENGTYFVKLNRRVLLPMFEAEYEGLKEISDSRAVRVPRPAACGEIEDRSYLVMEMIKLSSGNRRSDESLGSNLARMHQSRKPYFGWSRDNTIGSTPQMNEADDNWVVFWREKRLRFQLDLAESNGYGGRLIESGERLCELLGCFFTDYRPHPSLLHGDLWAGNAAVDDSGEPVIFDPACYYGDREADLAMTELFGGFGAGFYSAYNAVYPLDRGYALRKTLYNLYHILNHLNLFGGGYHGQAQSMIDRLLAEIR